MLKELDDEDTLKAIYLHEYGHILNNHFQAKKFKLEELNKESSGKKKIAQYSRYLTIVICFFQSFNHG